MALKIEKGWYLLVVLLLMFFVQTVASVELVEAQQGTVGTYAAYQEFENGLMIWREDTGDIFVFVRSPNTWYRFSEAGNENLPDNPVLENPPRGYVKPIRGFGRIWGNYAHVRNQLGWGMHNEFGYTAFVSYGQGYPNWESISLPHDDVVKFYVDSSWFQVPGTILPTPLPPPASFTQVTGATFQEFERGMMIYAGNSGTIWVLLDNGEALTYRTYDYGRLPDNPVWEQPSSGYINPIMGFGKVWGNFPSVRNELGWALVPEASYRMQIGHDANYSWVIMQLPSGEWIQVATSGSWYYR
jgi:hypothetical protein